MYVFICGGHHDSDGIAVLVMVSKGESIHLVLCILAKIKISFLPSEFCTRDRRRQSTDKANCIVHADYLPTTTTKSSGGFAN